MKENLNPMKHLNDLNNLKVQRKQLEDAEATFREAIEQQFDVVEEMVRKGGRTLLIIGGTALVVFGIAQTIIQGRREKEEEKKAPEVNKQQPMPVAPKEESPIVKAIKNQIAMFLAAMVKQKLIDFLERIDRLDDEGEDNQPKAEAPVKEI